MSSPLYSARPELSRLTAWATPRASSDVERCFAIDARGVAHAVKRGKGLILGRARYVLPPASTIAGDLVRDVVLVEEPADLVAEA